MNNWGMSVKIPRHFMYDRDYLDYEDAHAKRQLGEKLTDFLLDGKPHQIILQREIKDKWEYVELCYTVVIGDTTTVRDITIREIDPLPVLNWNITDKSYCSHCGSTSKDDERGNCIACGAPRD